MTKLCRTYMITLWIVNRREKYSLRIWNIASLLQWSISQLAYCHSSRSKCPPLARTQARRRLSTRQLRYQLHSVEGRDRCSSSSTSHNSAVKFLGNGEKDYIYSVGNSFLFPRVEEFSKWINNCRSYCKSSLPHFLKHSADTSIKAIAVVSRRSALRWSSHKLGSRRLLLFARSWLPFQRQIRYEIMPLGDRIAFVRTACREFEPRPASLDRECD